MFMCLKIYILISFYGEVMLYGFGKEIGNIVIVNIYRIFFVFFFSGGKMYSLFWNYEKMIVFFIWLYIVLYYYLIWFERIKREESIINVLEIVVEKIDILIYISK